VAIEPATAQLAATVSFGRFLVVPQSGHSLVVGVQPGLEPYRLRAEAGGRKVALDLPAFPPGAHVQVEIGLPAADGETNPQPRDCR